MEKSTKNKIYRAIGLMSGTAMDGIDAALIETDGHAYIKTLGFETLSHTDDLKSQLQKQLNKTSYDMSVEDKFTQAQIPVIHSLLNKTGFTASDIDVIGFHGQTTHHDPDNGITIQMGNGDLLAKETEINVIYDFRTNDMKAGGQGAPLIPVYHRALLQSANIPLPVAIINIGGVANVTWISENTLIGFDTGPGNALIDDWIKTHNGDAFDKNGSHAQKGNIDYNIINDFLAHPYFDQPYPKSLDRNDFSAITPNGLSLEDGATTLTAMTVKGLAHSLSQCPEQPQAIYVTGGGRHNNTMMTWIEKETNIPTHSVDDLGWNGDAVEAEGFAYMAVRTIINEPISFPTTTGCTSPTIGGKWAKSKKANVA